MHQSKSRRIFILAEREFPSGNAGGTRVRFMAKMFQLLGFEVIILALGDNSKLHYDVTRNGYYFDGIQYYNSPVSGGGVRRFIDRYLLSGPRTIRALKRMGFHSDCNDNKDVVIVYTTNAIYGAIVLNYVAKRYSVWLDVVEWFQKENFALGILSLKYWLYQYCLNYLYPKTRQVIAISSVIEREFSRRGCKTVTIPCLYDSSLGMRYARAGYSSSKVRLIYSGNPGMKENLAVMFRALVVLSVEERARFELNFTGVSASVIRKLLGRDSYLLAAVSDMVIFHPWLDYDDLLKLYADMHYLYFIREPFLWNLANFPMKLPELMSLGVVPLTTKIGDYGVYLKDNVNSILVSNSDVSSCRNALLKAASLSHEEFSMLSEGAKKCANENFDYRSFGGKMRVQLSAVK